MRVSGSSLFTNMCWGVTENPTPNNIHNKISICLFTESMAFQSCRSHLKPPGGADRRPFPGLSSPLCLSLGGSCLGEKEGTTSKQFRLKGNRWNPGEREDRTYA